MKTLIFLAALPLLAADTQDWQSLTALRAGDKVGVIQSNMKRVEGRFESFNNDTLVISGGQPVTLPKAEVVRVYKRGALSRTKRTLLGAGIGAVAGVVFNETAGQRINNEGSYTDAERATAVVGGAAAGAAVGALTGNGYKTVYQRAR